MLFNTRYLNKKQKQAMTLASLNSHYLSSAPPSTAGITLPSYLRHIEKQIVNISVKGLAH
jgi:hypothetical protein